MEKMRLNEPLEVAEALRLGLVNPVVRAEAMGETTMEMARKLTSGAAGRAGQCETSAAQLLQAPAGCGAGRVPASFRRAGLLRGRACPVWNVGSRNWRSEA